MSNTSNVSDKSHAPQTESNEPPRWLINAMKFVLRTPLHGLFSKSIMVLPFRGRKSGTVNTTPVSYL